MLAYPMWKKPKAEKVKCLLSINVKTFSLLSDFKFDVVTFDRIFLTCFLHLSSVTASITTMTRFG